MKSLWVCLYNDEEYYESVADVAIINSDDKEDHSLKKLKLKIAETVFQSFFILPERFFIRNSWLFS